MAILRVRNVGRMTATVTWWQLDIGDNAIGPSLPPFPSDAPLPFALNPVETKDWRAEAVQVQGTASVLSEGGQKTDPLRASILLGDGRTVRSSPVPGGWQDIQRFFGL